MTDTPPEVMERYRAMLLARSPEERLKMGCSMSATARALVRASVLAQDPHASPAALRRALFLRFYGHEFGAAQRERIMDWLGRDEPPPAGSPRRVPVNWDDLEMALTANDAEWTCYFDLRTGEVQMVPADRFGDDGDCPSGISPTPISTSWSWSKRSARMSRTGFWRSRSTSTSPTMSTSRPASWGGRRWSTLSGGSRPSFRRRWRGRRCERRPEGAGASSLGPGARGVHGRRTAPRGGSPPGGDESVLLCRVLRGTGPLGHATGRLVEAFSGDLALSGLEAGHLFHVEPLGSSVEYGWMAEFASSVGDVRLWDRLEVPLDGRGAFRRFRNVLLDFAAERKRWFAFRDERLRAAAREWPAEHEIEPTTEPPERTT